MPPTPNYGGHLSFDYPFGPSTGFRASFFRSGLRLIQDSQGLDCRGPLGLAMTSIENLITGMKIYLTPNSGLDIIYIKLKI